MNSSFYNNSPDFKYPEIAICMEDSVGQTAKFFIPIATPMLSKNTIYDNKSLAKRTTNIVSDHSSMYIEPCIESNYIELKLPENTIAKKGDKFIIAFIGGDVNNGSIIGRYNK